MRNLIDISKIKNESRFQDPEKGNVFKVVEFLIENLHFF